MGTLLRYGTSIIFFVYLVLGVPVDAAVSISVDGGSGLINTTNQSALSITGSIPSFLAGTVNATATDSIGGTVSQSKNLVALDRGNFSLVVDTISLIDGVVTVVVEAVESGGTISTSSPSTLTKQTVVNPPEIIFFTVPRTTVASDCALHPEYFLPYASTTPTNQSVCGVFATSTIATPLNSDGTHLYSANDSFTFTFQDEFGNTGSVVGSVQNIDSVAPVILITSPLNGETMGQSFIPSMTVTDTSTTTSQCSLNTTLLADCALALSDLSIGSHSFYVDATDSAGNLATSSVSFTVSRTFPALQFVATSTALALQPIDNNATTTLEIVDIGTSTVSIASGTLFTRTDGATLTPAELIFATSTGANFTNVITNAVIDGAFHFGITGVGILSSASTTMNIYLGASNDGAILSIFRSIHETSGWLQDGATDISCVVTLGVCSFQTSSLGYFAIVHIVVPPPPPSGGGGGGGGGPIFLSTPIVSLPVTPPPPPPRIETQVLETQTPEGLVLGATTYNFTTTLSIGSEGSDVTALQEFLTREGVYTGPITGYFGVLTERAVKVFQTNIGLESVGIVGPKTRAELNKGYTQAPPRSNLTSMQKEALMGLLRAFNADESVIAKLEAEL